MTFNEDELRVLALSSPTIIKMLRSREERIISRIYGEYKNGKLDHLAAISEFAATRGLLNEVIAAQNQHGRGVNSEHTTG